MIMKQETKKDRGITLIALTITIVILIILSSVGIYLSLENNGIFSKAQQAKSETIKQTATEKMNLKITNMQIEKYAKEQRMPTLQEFADELCEDNEIQYVELQSKKVGSLDKINVGNADSLFTKLKDYPYEFEINSSLQLASIDGVQVAKNDGDTVTLTQSQYNSILNRLSALENTSTDSNNNYSNEEQVIGKWIDSKPLYRRVYNLTTPSKAESTCIKDLTDLNIETAVKVDGYIRYTDTASSPLNIMFGDKDFVATWFNPKNICMKCTYSARFNKPCYIIIEYTKTTDTVQ